MDRLLLDLRLGLRRLTQNPGFTAVAVLTLTLGIGANTAIFSAINAVLLRPLPAERPSELVALNEMQGGQAFPSISYPNYRDLRDRNQVLTGLIHYEILPVSMGVRGNSQRLWGYQVTGNYFDVLGVRPARGRLLHPEDDRIPGGHPVMVLSYACWQKRFGGDENVIGRVEKVNGRDFTILGVAPRGFFGTELYFSPEVYFPMTMEKELQGDSALERRESSRGFVVGRLKPGVSQKQAEAGLNSVAQQLAAEYPQQDAGMKIVLTPPGLAGNYVRPAVIGFASALFGVSGLVLLIACTNLASMLLARSADRRKETAIRLALGAGRGMLIRQLLTENLVLALAGGVGGALLAWWITDGIAAWRPPIDIPLLVNVSADVRVFLFAVLSSVATTLLFGLIPALQSTKAELVGALKNESAPGQSRHWHLRDYMVACQVGLCALLLVCSVLVVRSLQHSLDAPIGYNPKGAVTLSFDLNLQGYDEARGRVFERRVLERVRSLPGIESAALIDNMPLSINISSGSVFVDGKPAVKATEAPVAFTFSVSGDYFRTMQSRLLKGRDFDARDLADKRRVAVINQAFADRLMAGEDPIGKRFRTRPEGQPIEIVGVVQDGKYFSLTEDRMPAWWGPLDTWYSSNACVVARSGLSGPDALAQIRRVIKEINPAMALFSEGTLVDQLELPLFPARIAASALASFGILALVLAATGIYGVMAYSVSRRTREIGIRVAIGASREQVLGIVLRRAAWLIGSGTVVGLALASIVGRLLGRLLYGVSPWDPVTFGIALALMMGIALLACWIPARRAMRIDPNLALRQE